MGTDPSSQASPSTSQAGLASGMVQASWLSFGEGPGGRFSCRPTSSVPVPGSPSL